MNLEFEPLRFAALEDSKLQTVPLPPFDSQSNSKHDPDPSNRINKI